MATNPGYQTFPGLSSTLPWATNPLPAYTNPLPGGPNAWPSLGWPMEKPQPQDFLGAPRQYDPGWSPGSSYAAGDQPVSNPFQKLISDYLRMLPRKGGSFTLPAAPTPKQGNKANPVQDVNLSPLYKAPDAQTFTPSTFTPQDLYKMPQIDMKALAGIINPALENKTARGMAAQTIGNIVNALTTQQSQFRDQGRMNAGAMLAAAEAAANINPNLANQDAANGRSAADLLSSIEGSLNGAPAPSQHLPTTPGGFNPNTAPAAIQAALKEGSITPFAHTLLTQGNAAAAEAGLLPSIIMNAGGASSLLAQGAGNQKANALNANISNEEAKFPQLVQQYLASLSSQDQKRFSNALALAKLNGTPADIAKLNAQISHWNATGQSQVDYHNQQGQISVNRANATAAYNTASLNERTAYHNNQMITAHDKAIAAAAGIDTGLTNATGVITFKDGSYRTDPKTGFPATKVNYHWDAAQGKAVKDGGNKGDLTGNEQETIWQKVGKAVDAGPNGNYTSPSVTQGRLWQAQISPAVSPNDLWHQQIGAHPILFKSKAALDHLLGLISQRYGTSFFITPNGDLRTYVGLGGGIANVTPDQKPVLTQPLG